MDHAYDDKSETQLLIVPNIFKKKNSFGSQNQSDSMKKLQSFAASGPARVGNTDQVRCVCVRDSLIYTRVIHT